MLGIFHKGLAHPPTELNSPGSKEGQGFREPQNPDKILNGFLSSHPENSLSLTLGDGAAIAYVQSENHFSIHRR